MTDIDKEREAINDKALDELVSRADAMTDYDPLDTSEQSVREFASDCYNKITALRARVGELEEDREKLCDALTEQSRIGLRWAREARQVTREQLDRIIGMIEMKTTSYEAPACAEGILEVLNLEIVEEGHD